MSGRPKRASAQAALAAIKKTDKRSKREEEETEAPDEEGTVPTSPSIIGVFVFCAQQVNEFVSFTNNHPYLIVPLLFLVLYEQKMSLRQKGAKPAAFNRWTFPSFQLMFGRL